MNKFVDQLLIKEKTYDHLASENSNAIAINDYNRRTLSTLLPIGWSLSLLPLAASIFSETMRRAIPAYLLTFSAFFVLFLLFRRPGLQKQALPGLYVTFTVFFLFGIYLSTVHSPNMNATILLGGFAIMPLSIIDRPTRLSLFLVFWLVVHTILAFF